MINTWSYIERYQQNREEILAEIDRVFQSGRLILGAEVSKFEKSFAEFTNCDYCVSVDNGTNAIALGLRAIEIGPGDEVITVANTAAPTAVAIAQVGATPVFVDIDEYFLIDVDKVPSAITDRTKAILPVHLYGQCADLERLSEIARENSLYLLEDCAQAHGALRNGVKAGSWGDWGAFSFYPTKVLGAFGDGGALTSSNRELVDKVKRLRYYGMGDRYFVEELPGFNSRLDEVQAALLSYKLQKIDQEILERQKIASFYYENFKNSSLGLPCIASGNNHVFYLFVARHSNREAIIRYCHERGLNLTTSYRWPIHQMTAFRSYPQFTDLRKTEKAAEEVFSLPMYPGMTDEIMDKILDILSCALKRFG